MPTPSLDALPKGHQLPPFAFELSPAWVREYVVAVDDEAIGVSKDNHLALGLKRRQAGNAL